MSGPEVPWVLKGAFLAILAWGCYGMLHETIKGWKENSRMRREEFRRAAGRNCEKDEEKPTRPSPAELAGKNRTSTLRLIK